MSQHDYDIANQTFPNTRADINNALLANRSLNSGTSAPSSTTPYMLWADTTTGLLKIRDAADSAWIVIGRLDGEGFGMSAQGSNVASASTIDLDAATGNMVDVTGTTTITAITLSQGRWRWVRFTGALTLTHGSSLVLPGAANIVTAAGDWGLFYGGSGGVVRCASFLRASGLSLLPSTPLIESKTASSSASLDFTSGIGTAYDRYRLDLINLQPATNDVSLYIRVGSSTGFKSGATDYQYVLHHQNANAPTLTAAGSTGAAQIAANPSGTLAGLGNSSNRNLDGSIWFTRPAGVTQNIYWDITYLSADGYATRSTGSASYGGAAITMDRIQLLMSSGNIAAGTAKLYGVRPG